MAGSVDCTTVAGSCIQYDEQGNEVARWPAPGSAGFAMSAATPGTSLIGKDGRGIPMSTPAIDPLTAQPLTAPAEAVPIEQTPWYETGGSSGGGYSRSYNRTSYASGGGYAGGGYGGAADYGGFGGGSPAAPRYADGTTHPFFGGAPRNPGGIFAAQSGGDDFRPQVTSSSGATAGPFEISAAPAPDGGAYGGGGGGYGGGGGGGGFTRDIISRVRGNVMGRLGGIGAGGPGATDYAAQERQYQRQGRRMDRAADRYNEALSEPQYMPVRGWAKRQGYSPGMTAGALGDPSVILGDVFPNADVTNTAMDEMAAMPMTDLALLTFGTRGRGLMSKTPTVDVPNILKRNAGYEEAEPEFKRSLNPSKAVNKIALMYRQMAEGQQFDTEALLGNLAHTKKKSALGQGLTQQATFDPGGALGQIGSYVHSAFSPMGNTAFTRSLHRDIDRDMRALGPKALRKKPERISKAARQIGRSFLG